VVVVEHLRKTFGGLEVFGILGRNGAGKTTTVECLEGLRRRAGAEVGVGSRLY
jgi:ABC-2 type transport system ATP-binding protein